MGSTLNSNNISFVSKSSPFFLDLLYACSCWDLRSHRSNDKVQPDKIKLQFPKQTKIHKNSKIFANNDKIIKTTTGRVKNVLIEYIIRIQLPNVYLHQNIMTPQPSTSP